MTAILTGDQAGLILAQPGSDGAFSAREAKLARAMGERRPLVMLAFAPKAAGTFFRSAVIRAVDGQLVRIVHAQGSRDAQPYLPLFVKYYGGEITDKILVAHVHMQALAANRHFLDAFGIKSIIMLRNIADMMASYWDMMEGGEDAANLGLNFDVPANFSGWPAHAKQDYLATMLIPWYASYFASWAAYQAHAPGSVAVLRFDDLLTDPVGLLQNTLQQVGLPAGEKRCRDAFAAVWNMRAGLRFNQGRAGRGGEYFTAAHRERIARTLSYYDVPKNWLPDLV